MSSWLLVSTAVVRDTRQLASARLSRVDAKPPKYTQYTGVNGRQDMERTGTGNIGAFITRIGFGGILHDTYNKEPP